MIDTKNAVETYTLLPSSMTKYVENKLDGTEERNVSWRFQDFDTEILSIVQGYHSDEVQFCVISGAYAYVLYAYKMDPKIVRFSMKYGASKLSKSEYEYPRESNLQKCDLCLSDDVNSKKSCSIGISRNSIKFGAKGPFICSECFYTELLLKNGFTFVSSHKDLTVIQPLDDKGCNSRIYDPIVLETGVNDDALCFSFGEGYVINVNNLHPYSTIYKFRAYHANYPYFEMEDIIRDPIYTTDKNAVRRNKLSRCQQMQLSIMIFVKFYREKYFLIPHITRYEIVKDVLLLIKSFFWNVCWYRNYTDDNFLEINHEL